MKETLVSEGTISEKDFDLFRIVDSAAEARDKIMEYHNKYMTTPEYLGPKTNF